MNERTARHTWDWSSLLHQSDVWVDKDKNTRKISEMDRPYAERVYRFLLAPRRAKGILAAISTQSFLCEGPTPGTMAADLFDRELDALLESQDDPVQWMKSTPLVAALYARAWGPEPEESTEDVVHLITLKVKASSGDDLFDITSALEEAIEPLAYDIEITNVTT